MDIAPKTSSSCVSFFGGGSLYSPSKHFEQKAIEGVETQLVTWKSNDCDIPCERVRRNEAYLFRVGLHL